MSLTNSSFLLFFQKKYSFRKKKTMKSFLHEQWFIMHNGEGTRILFDQY